MSFETLLMKYVRYRKQHELGTILYPVLVHMYLELVYNNHSEEAKQLVDKFGGNLEEYYQNDLKRLSNVTRREQMAGNELTDTFKYVTYSCTISSRGETLHYVKCSADPISLSSECQGTPFRY